MAEWDRFMIAAWGKIVQIAACSVVGHTLGLQTMINFHHKLSLDLRDASLVIMKNSFLKYLSEAVTDTCQVIQGIYSQSISIYQQQHVSPNLVKSQSGEVKCWIYHIALKCDSITAEMPVKFHSNLTALIAYLVLWDFVRCGDKKSYHFVNRGPELYVADYF